MKKSLLILAAFCSFQAFSQNYKVEEIKVNDQLMGDLYDSPNKETVVLIIPGSGPTDRNGNTLGATNNNSLKYLAQGIAENDIDVLTYDKRVVFILKNKLEIPELDFQHGIDDAKTIVDYLKNTKGYKNVIITGHSEGSLIGMIAAQNNTEAYISLAGSGKPIDEILEEQINKQAPMLNEANIKILKQLKAGTVVKEVHPFLKGLYAEHNQPFLIDWMRYNPQTEIAKLKLPILIINGTKDIQVGVENAELLHQAVPSSQKVIIENMNHIFKEITKDEQNAASYNNPDLPIQKELVGTIVNFINKTIK